MLRILSIFLMISIITGQLTPDGCRFQTGQCRYEVKLSQEGTCKKTDADDRLKQLEEKLKLLETTGSDSQQDLNTQKMLLKEVTVALQAVQNNLAKTDNEKKSLENKLQNSTEVQNVMTSRLLVLEKLVDDLRTTVRNDSRCSDHVVTMQQKLEDARKDYVDKLADLQTQLNTTLHQLNKLVEHNKRTSEELVTCTSALARNNDCLHNLTTVEALLEKQILLNNMSVIPVVGGYPQVAKSCSDWRKMGFNHSGLYIIDPDGYGQGVGPLEVDCGMNMASTVTTIRPRNGGPAETNKCKTPLCHSIEIQYGALVEQVAAVIDNSKSCQQFIKFTCFASNLFLTYGNTTYSAWYSRDGKQMRNWGGVEDGKYGCACGLTTSCAKKHHRCNCDTGDRVSREDAGQLTNKNNLPVTRLAFGKETPEYNDNAFGKFYLGPVSCEDDIL